MNNFGLDDPVLNLCRAGDFGLHRNAQTGCWAHQVFFSVGTGVFFPPPGMKRTGLKLTTDLHLEQKLRISRAITSTAHHISSLFRQEQLYTFSISIMFFLVRRLTCLPLELFWV